MSFRDCIDTAIKGGEISEENGKRLKRDFERFRDQRAKDSPTLADAQARQDLIDLLTKENRHQRRIAKLALNNIREVAAELSNFRTASGKPDIAKAAVAKLESYHKGINNVAGRTNVVIGEAQSRMAGFLEHFRRGALWGDKNRHNAAQLPNVVRELFGEGTGDQAAAEYAAAVADTFEYLRRRFNAAGGAISKLEKWGMPQAHSQTALLKAGKEEWLRFTRPLLDPSRMKHPLTGQPLGGRSLDEALDHVYDSIAMDGWNTRQPSRQRFGRGAIANQRDEERFLVFRDANAWMAYQQAFGKADIFGSIQSHIVAMAKDIAAMEVLGPNPAGTVEWLKQAVEKEAAKAAAGKKALTTKTGLAAVRYGERAQEKLDVLWQSIRGDLETPVNQWAANAAGTARALISASVLGQAALSSISDLATGMITRKFAGLPASHAIPQVVKAFTQMERTEAVAAGLILDDAVHMFHHAARYEGSFNGPQTARYISDRVLTWSGLLPWTQAGKHAFGMAFMSEAAKNANRAWKTLPDAFRETLARGGLAERDWDLIRRANLYSKYDGTQILRPREIAERINDKLASRYLQIVQELTEYAVPTGGHNARVFLTRGTRPGTGPGEVLRSMAQFKSFGVAFMLLHGAEIAMRVAADHARGGWKAALTGQGAAYAGALLISTTVFGGAALQLKQIVAGRDPRDMTTDNFWGAALLQGGGLGLYGDFLFSDLNRYGGGLPGALSGPLAERANDLLNLSFGNVMQLAGGEKTNFGKELARFARGNIPGSNIWYMRLAWERLLLDQMNYLADPEANKAFKRVQRRWSRDYGQDFWWAPGKVAPSRGPDLGAAMGR